MAIDPRAAHWFTVRRGIPLDVVEQFGIYTEGKDLVIPYPGGLTKRRFSTDPDNPFGLEKEGRRFVWNDADGSPAGAGQVPFLPPAFAPAERMLLLEGETDTLAAFAALPETYRDRVSIVGLSGADAWKPRYKEELFAPASRVFVVMDNDDPYTAQAAVESTTRAWEKIRGDLGSKARRVRLPQGIKDVAEFFMQYDWHAFEALLKAAAQPKRHYPRLDLTQPAPPTDWLVEGLLVRGEVTVLAGDAGVGKSFLTMALAVAIASGAPDFLGRSIHRHGPVLYVDEENTRDIVLQRLQGLGLKPADAGNLEYLSYAGVDLHSEPALLLEEAVDLGPALIVLDSQSAVSIGAEENSNDDMTRLFKTAFRPLARETGAAVVVLHHTPKDGKGIPRGAGAIKAQADQVISIVEAEAGDTKTGRLNIFPSKARRQMSHLTAQIVGELEHDGWVRVQSPEEVM